MTNVLALFIKVIGLGLPLLVLAPTGAAAHTVHYQVAETGISARIFFSANEPAAYSEYEIHGPGDPFPHQRGRTDRNGFVAFLPDRTGLWLIEVKAESAHGPHPLNIEVEVGEGLFLAGFKKPLVATHLNIFIALGVMGWLFGLWAIFTIKRQNSAKTRGKDSINMQ